ncbi:MAG: glycosyltransferase family 2 protein [Elusimicrobia bacterium]|nr:glycosyltransferase family 2 protein [Elusimicrobiota bacterium]
MAWGKAKVLIVLPAYNAAKTLEATVREIPKELCRDILLVDDGSQDQTFALAQSLGLRAIRHGANRGYGANQKTCYLEALKTDAQVILMIHPDYQYDPGLTPYLVGLIRDGICDVVLGNRIRTRREALAGGMPVYKYLANRALSLLENLWMGQNLGEWHTGLRAYSRKVLETVRWEDNSDDFVFDQQMLFQISLAGFRIGDIPTPARYFSEASSIHFRPSLLYGLQTLGWLLLAVLYRWRIYRHPRLAPKKPLQQKC